MRFCLAFLSSNVRCYIQSASCFIKTHQQFSLLPLQVSLAKTESLQILIKNWFDFASLQLGVLLLQSGVFP